MRIKEARQRLVNANVPEVVVDQEIAEALEYGMTADFLAWRLNHLAVVAEKKLEQNAANHAYQAQFNEV